MSLSQAEILDNIGDAFKAVAKASNIESDGGVTVTLSEIISIVSSVGIKVVNDISDTEDDV